LFEDISLQLLPVWQNLLLACVDVDQNELIWFPIFIWAETRRAKRSRSSLLIEDKKRVSESVVLFKRYAAHGRWVQELVYDGINISLCDIM
jgi:hypothetical protein